MIIKFLRWKQALFYKLINYINQNCEYNPLDQDVVLHNIRNQSNLQDIASEFSNHDAARINLRVNSTRIFHEILAFHLDDAPFLEDKANREKIARKYAELRANDGMVFGRWHTMDEQGNPTHPHLHLCISGTALETQKVLRLDNRKFKALLRNMERWSIKEMPELSASIVHIDKPEVQIDSKERDRNTRAEKEYLMKKRTHGAPSEKDLLTERLYRLIDQSYSRDDLFDQVLQQSDLEIYGYAGKSVGIQVRSGRKYRFDTLQLQQKLLELDNQEQQLIKKHMAEMEGARKHRQEHDRSKYITR